MTTRIRLLLNSIPIVVMVFLFVSCNTKTVVQDSEPIALEGWDKNEKISLTIPMADTLNMYNVFVTLRIRENYPYSNLYLFVTSHAPGGVFITDTVQYTLFDGYGEEIGKWSSGLGDYRLPFMQKAVFLKEGEYKFDIAHGMRMDVLPGVVDVGICVEEPDN